MKTSSTLKAVLALLLLTLPISSVFSQVTNINLDKPTLYSGAERMPGAVYKYTNVNGNASNSIDAYVLVVGTTNTGTNHVGLDSVDISASSYGGYQYAFQPAISSSATNTNTANNTNGTWSIGSCGVSGGVQTFYSSYTANQDFYYLFEMYFKKGGTQIDTAINFKVAIIDIDGYGSSSEVEQAIIAGGDSYTVDANTSLTIGSVVINGIKYLRARGAGPVANGISLTSIDQITQIGYSSTNRFRFGWGSYIGSSAPGANSCFGSPGRLNSMSLSTQPTFTNPITKSTLLTISGTVWDDADGSGTSTFTNIKTGNEVGFNGTANPLYVYVLDTASGTIQGKAQVSSTGTYSIPNIPWNAGLYMLLSTSNVAEGVTQNAPNAGSLPAGVVATSPITTPNFVTDTVNITRDFGIEKLPVATTPTIPTQTNPGGTNQITLTQYFAGTDADGSVSSITFTGFPSGVTSITIGSTTYTSAPANAVTVPVGTVVTIDPVDGAGTVTIPFTVIDNAGKTAATPTAAVVPIADLMISGTVYDDADGGTINGTATNTIGTNTIYANLVANGVVVKSKAVASNGTFSFGTADGIKSGTVYSVAISNGTQAVNAAVTTTLVNAVNTAEGTTTAGDGSANGIVVLPAITANVTTYFGVDQLPVATTPTIPAQTNPGGTNQITLTSYFTGTDADGSVSSITFTTFPTGVTSITIGSTTYTSFTAGSVTVPVGTVVTIDPVDGAGSATIPFKTVDNAGKTSTTAANAVVNINDVTVSGTVYDDPNGAVISGTATNTIGTNTIYVNLIANGVVVTSKAVAANGTYSFGTADGIKTGVSYTVAVSNGTQAVGNAVSTALVNAANTAESLGGVNDATADGSIVVGVLAANVVVNFGIDQLPLATVPTIPTQSNPGGTNQITLTSYFAGTDADGSVSSITFTTFPTGVTSITIGSTTYTSFTAGSVTVPVGTVVTIDPVDGAGSATIPFKTVDNAGKTSTTAANAVVNINDVTVSGTVYDDPNGAVISGTATNTIGTNTIYVNLIANGVVVTSKAVAANGTYSFGTADGIKTGVSYTVAVSNGTQAVGNAVSTALVNAANTAESLGGVNDATADGSIVVGVLAANVVVNFGIDQLPLATVPTIPTQSNPGGTNQITLTSYFAGTDADGSVSSITFTTFPTGVTSITIGSTTYTSFTAGGVTVPVGTVVTIDPVDGTGSATIPFKTVDNAGKTSTTAANAVVPIADLTVSGTVYDDADGGTINGTATNTIGTNTIYANLISGGVVVKSKAVAANGTYSFGTADGVKTGTAYTVAISNGTQTLGNAVSTTLVNAVNTAESLNGVNDATADGSIVVGSIAASAVANFGVDQLPFATTPTIPAQMNPGGTNQITLTSYFTGTDADGSVSSITFTTFPTGVTSITIGSTTYTSFTAGSVTVPVGTVVTIDPVNGAGTVTIPFKTVDNAGKTSTTAANAVVNINDVVITGTVYHDADGGTISGTPTNIIGSNTIYANLIANGVVVTSKAVAANGTFTFGTADGIKSSTAYTVAISNGVQTVGNAVATTLVNAANTADELNTTYDAAGSIDGSVVAGILTNPSTTVAFGVDIKPVAVPANPSQQQNPNGSAVSITTAFGGTDQDGTVTSLHFTTFPTGVASIIIAGSPYSSFTASGVTVPFGSTVSIIPNSGEVTAAIPYAVIDNAGIQGTTATVNAQFTSELALKVSALLQGPMQSTGTLMTTTLNTLHLIPLAQPYNTAPYNVAPFAYTGTEKVTAIPANVTDWVLVEIHDANTPATTLARKACFIKNDGTIIDTTGSTTLYFKGLKSGTYHIVIRHRNHLGIRTSTAPNFLADVVTSYDFRTGAGQAAGTNAMILVNGVYTMQLGNTQYSFNSSNQQAILNSANNSDVDVIKNTVLSAVGNATQSTSFIGTSVTNVYSNADVNLDGLVRYSASPSDVDLVISTVDNAAGNATHSSSYILVIEQLP